MDDRDEFNRLLQEADAARAAVGAKFAELRTIHYSPEGYVESGTKVLDQAFIEELKRLDDAESAAKTALYEFLGANELASEDDPRGGRL
jgi:hypothetical protein